VPPAQNQDLPPRRYSRESTTHWQTTIPDTRMPAQALGSNCPKAALTKHVAYQCGDRPGTLHQHVRAEVNSTRTISPASHPTRQALHWNARANVTNPKASNTWLESKENYHVVLWDIFNLGLWLKQSLALNQP